MAWYLQVTLSHRDDRLFGMLMDKVPRLPNYLGINHSACHPHPHVVVQCLFNVFHHILMPEIHQLSIISSTFTNH